MRRPPGLSLVLLVDRGSEPRAKFHHRETLNVRIATIGITSAKPDHESALNWIVRLRLVSLV